MAEVEVIGCQASGNSPLRLASLAQEEEQRESYLSPTLYPNPFENTFTLELPSSFTQATKFNVYNSLGQLIEQKYLNTLSLTKLGAQWSSGVYWIELRSGEEIRTLQVVKK